MIGDLLGAVSLVIVSIMVGLALAIFCRGLGQILAYCRRRR